MNKISKAIKFFIGGSIAVEFDEDIPNDLAKDYDIPIGDTSYVTASELNYPITDANDFIVKVLLAREKKTPEGADIKND